MQPDELKDQRKRVGFTQQDLADQIGMSRKAVVEMEAGRAPIERRTELATRFAVLAQHLRDASFAPDLRDQIIQQALQEAGLA